MTETVQLEESEREASDDRSKLTEKIQPVSDGRHGQPKEHDREVTERTINQRETDSGVTGIHSLIQLKEEKKTSEKELQRS